MKIALKFYLFFLLLGPLSAIAQSLVSVNALNYPVWLERNGESKPLFLADELLAGDVVRTGQSGRVWLSMADGSVVKLGESARFSITSARYESKQQNDVMTAALNVIKGAFRFTTSFFKPRRKTAHNVNIKIGAITAGLRGTDIWGRSTQSEDFVTLLEGSVMVEAEGEGGAILSVPLTLYLKKRGQPADSLGSVDAEKVPALAAETELSEQLGIVSGNGVYELVLASAKNKEGIDRTKQHYHEKGYAVQTVPVGINDEQYYRLVLRGLASMQSATSLSQRLKDEFSRQDIWINNQP